MKSRTGQLLSMAALWVCMMAPGARGATAQEVDTAIKKAVKFLYEKQNEVTGSWEEVAKPAPTTPVNEIKGGQWGGMTALVTYSLLAAGENPRDPRLKKAVDFLLRADGMRGIYALGMRAQVWQFLPRDEPNKGLLERAIRRDADLLYRARDQLGRYGYAIPPEVGLVHNSTSQYGVLGMWACAESGFGIEVPNSYWSQVETGWRLCQGKDGGWSYLSSPAEPGNSQYAPHDDSRGWTGKTSSGTMTAAGIATLFITQDYLRANEGVECRGNITNPSIQAGLSWMAKNYNPAWLDGYFLYGVERIGVASGYKYFGEHDWYKEGAESLVKTQAADGSWDGNWGHQVPNTALGILFMVRGRAPVVINKLEYTITNKARSEVGPWTQRPRDCANIVRWLGGKIEQRDLNWQIVNLQSPAEALHEAPLLYIAGNQSLSFTEQEQQTLRQFVERGGIILGNADGSSKLFAESFRKLGKALFPGATMRDLPEDHPIYTRQNFPRSTWRTKPRVEGLTNGVRELMLLLPDDPARFWQLRSFQPQASPFAEVLADIFLYAMDKQNLRFKGDPYLAEANPAVKAAGYLKVARLAYEGNWDPEPGGWAQFTAVLHNTRQIDLEVNKVELGQGKLKDYKVAHLTGTDAVTLSDEQRAELKAFIAGGGTLIMDAAGGAEMFASTALGELAKMEVATPRVLSATDPVISGGGTGSDQRRGRFRRFALRLVGTPDEPHLRASNVNGRKAVFFSEEDLSAGLVGNPMDGIKGYEPSAATGLMTNLMLYAMNQLPPAPPDATSQPDGTTTGPAASQP